MLHLVMLSVGSNADQSNEYVTDRAGVRLLWELVRGFAEAHGNAEVQMSASTGGAPIDPRTGTYLNGGSALRIHSAQRIPEDLSADGRIEVVGPTIAE